MEFNYFRIEVPQNADDVTLTLSDDLVETHWFTPEELRAAEQIPGSKEFMQELGYLK